MNNFHFFHNSLFFYLKISFFIFPMAFCNAQTENSSPYNYYFSPEFLLGKTAPSNENFPDLRLHKGYYLQFGKHQNQNPDEWAYRLNYPTTGISLGVSDLGNQKKIG